MAIFGEFIFNFAQMFFQVLCYLSHKYLHFCDQNNYLKISNSPLKDRAFLSIGDKAKSHAVVGHHDRSIRIRSEEGIILQK